MAAVLEALGLSLPLGATTPAGEHPRPGGGAGGGGGDRPGLEKEEDQDEVSVDDPKTKTPKLTDELPPGDIGHASDVEMKSRQRSRQKG